jgi:hypothetical protein
MFRPISPTSVSVSESESKQEGLSKRRIEWHELSWRARRDQKEMCIPYSKSPEFWDKEFYFYEDRDVQQLKANIEQLEKLSCTCELINYSECDSQDQYIGESINYCSRCTDLEQLYIHDCYWVFSDNNIEYPTFVSALVSSKGAKRNNKSWKHAPRICPKYDRTSAKRLNSKRGRRYATADLCKDLCNIDY